MNDTKKINLNAQTVVSAIECVNKLQKERNLLVEGLVEIQAMVTKGAQSDSVYEKLQSLITGAATFDATDSNGGWVDFLSDAFKQSFN